jgi:hypothetical protein
MAQKVLREIKKDLPRFCGRRIAVTVNRQVAEQLLGPERRTLEALEQELGREIEIRTRAGMHQEQFEIDALDEGAAIALDLPWLSSKAEAQEQPSASEEAAPIQAAPAETEGIGSPASETEPAAEEEPVLAAPSPSLDESAKSPIMQGSPEREEL